MCKPCSITYDFNGTVGNYDDDMRRILKSVNATKYISIPKRNLTTYKTKKSSEVLQTYLKDVPKSLVGIIYERYYKMILFVHV